MHLNHCFIKLVPPNYFYWYQVEVHVKKTHESKVVSSEEDEIHLSQSPKV